ncbi:MAG: glycine cleavage system protein GcvH [Halobacteriovoraceae bacterium]|nr:glycine cleavage system protein GcvH [Halobacteriovoraceae bacterium]
MAAKIPENLKYTKEHEWCAEDGDTVTVGITDFAQSSLGDIVFVELPDVGTQLKKDEPFGVVESIKSVSDLYAPVSGEVVEKNADVEESPELLNEEAYSSWLIKVKMTNPGELGELLDAKAYEDLC